MNELPTWFVLGGLAVLGLLVGSFLNVVAHRLPAGGSLVRPPSACPACGHAVRPYDNVPVVSWLLLRGRCRHCGEPISARYPAVELLTGLLFVLAGLRWGVTPYLLAALAVLAGGVAMVAIDLEHQRLPFALTGVVEAFVVTGLVLEVVVGTDGPAVAWAPVVGSVLLWLGVYGGVWLVTGGRGMGLGDVALAPVLGTALGWLGWGPSLVGLLGGFVVGALVGVVLMLTGRAGRRAKVPHGPFMIVGAVLGMFAGDALWKGYLGLFGLG